MGSLLEPDFDPHRCGVGLGSASLRGGGLFKGSIRSVCFRFGDYGTRLYHLRLDELLDQTWSPLSKIHLPMI